MYKKLLVGYDGSDGAKVALDHALQLAKDLGSEVCILWVRESLPHYPETIDEIEQERESADLFYRRITAEVDACSQKYGVDVRAETRSGQPAHALILFAQERAFDLIVLGNRGHSGLWGRFLGHTADKVSENAECSVLIVRTKA